MVLECVVLEWVVLEWAALYCAALADLIEMLRAAW